MPMRPWILAPAVTLGLLLLTGTAMAQPVDVIVDSTAVELKAADNGTHKTEIVLLNTGQSSVVVTAEIAGDPGCHVDPVPRAVPSGRRESITLTLSDACEVAKGVDIRLTFGNGVTPQTVNVTASAPKDDDPDWWILVVAAAIAIAIVVGIALWVLFRIRQMGEALKDPKAVAKRVASLQETSHRRQEARAARGLTSAGDTPLAEPEPPTIDMKTPLTGLGTDWSFSDSWVANATLGATALIALIAAADVLKAVLGAEPEAALALITVASAVAAFLVGLGPLILKAVGKETGIPTVGGAVLAGIVVLAGSLLQVAAVTIQAMVLSSHLWLQGILLLVGLFTAAFVTLYGARSLPGLIATGITVAPAETPPEIRAAWIVAKAIRPEITEVELSPLDIDEIVAEEEDVQGRLIREIAGVSALARAPAPAVRRRTALL